MRFEPLPIPGAWRIEPERVADQRGSFARIFSVQEFAAQGLVTDYPQRSISQNRKRGTLRGLHYQAAPHAETKLVRCTRGAAFDVIVDLREGPGFGRWLSIELSPDTGTTLYIPTGCAHGFQTLADDTEIDYAITPAYAPESARGIRFDDPELAISWPLAEKVMSDRDRRLPLLAP